MRKSIVLVLALAVLFLVPVVGGISAAENTEQYNALCDPTSPHYGGYGNEPSTMCVASFGGKLAEKNRALEAKVRELERQVKARDATIAKLNKEGGELKAANGSLAKDLTTAVHGWAAESSKTYNLEAQLKRALLHIKLALVIGLAALAILAICFLVYRWEWKESYNELHNQRDRLALDIEELQDEVDDLKDDLAEIARTENEQLADMTRQAEEREAHVAQLSYKLQMAENEVSYTRHQGLAIRPLPHYGFQVYDTEKPARPGVFVDVMCPGHGMHGAAKIELHNLRKHMESSHWKDRAPAGPGGAPAAPDHVVDGLPFDETLGGEA